MSQVPNDLHFTQTHEWLKKTGEDVTIGITDHAQALLGDLVFVDLPEVGAHISASDDLGVIESVKAAADFYAPISGTVIAVNQLVSNDPGLVNQDPYDAGWLVKIKPDDWSEIDHLLSSTDYTTQIKED